MQASKYVRALSIFGIVAVATLCTASCGMMVHHLTHGFVKAPPASEFGLGPRASTGGTFTATVVPDKPLDVGKLQVVRLRLEDASGNPLTGASVAVDGGMPQHGHGLPTKPRVTRTEGDGTYVVEGLRFNMGGWWELKFAVARGAATDSVTFNIRL